MTFLHPTVPLAKSQRFRQPECCLEPFYGNFTVLGQAPSSQLPKRRKVQYSKKSTGHTKNPRGRIPALLLTCCTVLDKSQSYQSVIWKHNSRYSLPALSPLKLRDIKDCSLYSKLTFRCLISEEGNISNPQLK